MSNKTPALLLWQSQKDPLPWSSKKELLFSQGDRDGALGNVFHYSPYMEDSGKAASESKAEHQPHEWPESTAQDGCALSPVHFSTWFPSLGKLHADLTFLKEPYNISLDDET